jgi:hypothetical protein
MTRFVVLIVLTALAVGIAVVLQRRRPEPPSVPSYRAPRQLDRDDFEVPAELVLVAVFTSATCTSCAGVWQTVSGLARRGVGVQRIEVQTSADLHRRYRIDGVPTTLVVAPDGVVAASFFGPVEADVIDAAIDGLAAG